ncbi:MAG: PAS domain-containing protein [Paracoccaceae bacterium]
MSFIERRNVQRPATGAAPFGLEEAFYSRTDPRGVIIAGNFVFQRISNYSWDEMIGAPHKIVRHPDMPKAVFWLMWNTIQQGKPIGAYVKNRTKDGLHYWVFAVVTPCPGGYLSARIKPTSSMLDTIQEEYARLRDREKKENLSPEQSAALLVERLRALGFPDYTQFATHALTQELLARDEGLGRTPDAKLSALMNTLDLAGKLEEATGRLVAEFGRMRITPVNMRVIASRLEPTGGPISSLSKNYGLMSQEITNWFDTTVVGPESNFASIRTSISHSIFVEGMTRILTQCSDQLASERRKLDHIDNDIERAFLADIVEEYSRSSSRNMAQVDEEAGRITDACDTMGRLILGLSTTKVLCSVENARLPVESESLGNIIEQLASQQERMSQQIEDIAELSSAIASSVATRGGKTRR